MIKIYDEDTIAAIATGMGGAGIGIIRISGQAAVPIAERLFQQKKGKPLTTAESHKLFYGYIVDPETEKPIDEVLVSKMNKPFSYTAEDVVEINCHGGIVPLQKILKMVLKQGARLAEPGEFTKRAFLNGRLDLTQAEAVMDVISAKTEQSLNYSMGQLEGHLSEKINEIDAILMDMMMHIEANIDYPEFDIETVSMSFLTARCEEVLQQIKKLLATAETGKIYREGITTAILGEPNVGKSSLLNYLLMENKAIVTNIPGTTRDVIEEYINIQSIPFKIIDTAGIRQTDNIVEKMGVDKARALIDKATLILFMRDASKPLSEEEEKLLAILKDKKTVLIANKIDLCQKAETLSDEWLPMSLKTDQGVETLRNMMVQQVTSGLVSQDADYIITNTRHVQLLETTATALENALHTISLKLPLELISIDLRDALENLRQITGKVVEDDIINAIFKNFCIGK